MERTPELLWRDKGADNRGLQSLNISIYTTIYFAIFPGFTRVCRGPDRDEPLAVRGRGGHLHLPAGGVHPAGLGSRGGRTRTHETSRHSGQSQTGRAMPVFKWLCLSFSDCLPCVQIAVNAHCWLEEPELWARIQTVVTEEEVGWHLALQE